MTMQPRTSEFSAMSAARDDLLIPFRKILFAGGGDGGGVAHEAFNVGRWPVVPSFKFRDYMPRVIPRARSFNC